MLQPRLHMVRRSSGEITDRNDILTGQFPHVRPRSRSGIRQFPWNDPESVQEELSIECTKRLRKAHAVGDQFIVQIESHAPEQSSRGVVGKLMLLPDDLRLHGPLRFGQSYSDILGGQAGVRSFVNK
jgi:hypothetical protein